MTTTATHVRQAIEEFIHERLNTKLAKLKPDQVGKRAQLEKAHSREAWLADAARRASQIRLATHILKPTHPDARGTNLLTPLTDTQAQGLVGTHSLGADRSLDVVGNAAALDVFKFLSTTVEDKSLLQLALDKDEAFLAALSDDPQQAKNWRDAFTTLASNSSQPASHTLAKQVYFPLKDASYHLLSPLFPTSLVHEAQRTMREDRFGDAAKAARKARWDGKPFPHGYREYPNLAIRKFGGTKPQNISQLNSERYGENWLLPSLPPSWEAAAVRPPWNLDSVFERAFEHQRRVQKLVAELRGFLERVDYNNLSIREHRAFLVGRICDEAHEFAARLRALEPGWTADPRCQLHEAEKLWLDPLRVHEDEEFRSRRLWGDWPTEVGHRFGNWLNAVLSKRKLALGDPEHQQWMGELSRELKLFREILEDDRA